MSEILLHKVPPHSLEHERAIISTCLQDRKMLMEILNILDADDFYDVKYSIIFKAITELNQQSKHIDLLSVAKHIRTGGHASQVTSIDIAQVTSIGIIYFDQIQNYCFWVKEKRMLRDASMKALAIYHACFDESNTIDEVSAMAESLSGVLVPSLKTGDTSKVGEIVPIVLDEIGLRASGSISQGVKTFMRSVDANIGFIGNSDLFVIGARPGMGKTAFILSAAIRQAQEGLIVGIFSMEMSNEQLTYRILSQTMNVSLENTMKKAMSANDLEHINRNLSKVDSLPIFMCDKAGMTIGQLRSRARVMKEVHGVQVIYVDYIQLIQGNQRGNREGEISEISRTLKIIAKELKIPIVALSQLSREVEKRADKRPMLSDLRESGAIEQDADMVGFLYRPEYYGEDHDANGNSTHGMAELIVAKNRNGATGTSVLRFIAQNAQYTEISQQIQHEDEPF